MSGTTAPSPFGSAILNVWPRPAHLSPWKAVHQRAWSCAPTLSSPLAHSELRGGQAAWEVVIPGGGTAECAGPVGRVAECRRYSSGTYDTSVITSKPACLNLIHPPPQKAASPPVFASSFSDAIADLIVLFPALWPVDFPSAPQAWTVSVLLTQQGPLIRLFGSAVGC